MFLRARVLPWRRGFAPGALALFFTGFCMESYLDFEHAIWIDMGMCWFATGGLFALAVAAWTATEFRSTAACVAMALAISLGGEFALSFGAFLLSYVVLDFKGGEAVALWGISLVLLGNVTLAWLLARAARAWRP